jgi:hypothetical protein
MVMISVQNAQPLMGRRLRNVYVVPYLVQGPQGLEDTERNILKDKMDIVHNMFCAS